MRSIPGYSRIDLDNVIIGMEVVCPDGLGRVVKLHGEGCCTSVEVRTYENNRGCHWAPANVLVKK